MGTQIRSLNPCHCRSFSNFGLPKALLVDRGFLVLVAIPNNVHAKEISTLRCNVFTVDSGSRRIRRGGFCVERNCADLSFVRVDCLSELVQLFLQSVSRSSFCSLSHHPQAAGRSCNLQDKGVVRRIAKDLSSPSFSDFDLCLKIV